MPITFTIDHPNRQIRSHATGSVGYAEIASHLAQEKNTQSLSYRELVNGRDAVATFTPDEARNIVELLRSLARETSIGRKAVVARAGVAFGLTRMIEMLAEDICEVRAFLDEGEALQWLERE